MLTNQINFKNFKINKNSPTVKKNFILLINSKNEILESLSKNYKNNFTKNITKKFKNLFNFRIIGMGGSVLGSQAIYDFLKIKIKKNFIFVNNLQNQKVKNNKTNYSNLVISKSGNTIETIVNANILIKKNEKNIFITEKRNSYLYILAQKLKAEIIHHNNFIGGRYSVLSEVGMLPAELMGLNSSNFRQLNNLIKNKRFVNSLISNVRRKVTQNQRLLARLLEVTDHILSVASPSSHSKTYSKQGKVGNYPSMPTKLSDRA